MPSVPQHLLDLYPPDRAGLLALACETVTDEALVMISKLDNGREAEIHLAKLREIRASKTVPAELDWEPREVLELCCHVRPDEQSFPGTPTNHRYTPWPSDNEAAYRNGHIAVVFSSAVILEHAQDHPGSFIGVESAYTSATRSCIELGRTYQAALARFLTHDIVRGNPHWLDPFYPFHALAITALALCVETLPAVPARTLRLALDHHLNKAIPSRVEFLKHFALLAPETSELRALDDPQTTELLNAIDELLAQTPDEPPL